MTKQTTKTENSNQGDAAAQIGAQSEALREAKRKLHEAVTAINALLQKTYDDANAARSDGADAWLEALSKHEYAQRARDYTESAIGRLNKISKGE